MLISGSCHCGNIRFELLWEPEPVEIPARACTCSFCVKHGGVWTSCPTGTLNVTVSEPELVTKYAFGTKTAQFHICSRCGIVPVVTSQIDGHLYAVVSVNAFEGIDRSLLKPASASFDGEYEQARLARRKRNWIAQVAFAEGENATPT
ncbi:GFA family protein [Variovorax sp. LARHSF232]